MDKEFKNLIVTRKKALLEEAEFLQMLIELADKRKTETIGTVTYGQIEPLKL